ncbi:MAG: hypothetical protein ACRDZX_13340 [Acidimicrobiales bacterium]
MGRTDPITSLLGPLDGARIPGGCGHCSAYQTVQPLAAGVWNVTVHHDVDCPVYARIVARSEDE